MGIKAASNIKYFGRKYLLMETTYAKKIFSNEKVDSDMKAYFKEIFEDLDSYGYIPFELGKLLERLMDDPTVVLGIHKTPGCCDVDHVLNDSTLQSIFNDGLKNFGDLSSGVYTATPEPFKAVRMISNPLNAVIDLKSSYKNNIWGFLVVFPAHLVTEDGQVINQQYSDIYNIVDGTATIKPEYLLGFVAQKDGVCTYYPKEEFIKKLHSTVK